MLPSQVIKAGWVGIYALFHFCWGKNLNDHTYVCMHHALGCRCWQENMETQIVAGPNARNWSLTSLWNCLISLCDSSSSKVRETGEGKAHCLFSWWVQDFPPRPLCSDAKKTQDARSCPVWLLPSPICSPLPQLAQPVFSLVTRVAC